MKTLMVSVLIIGAFTAKMPLGQTYSDINYNAGTSIEIQIGADVCADNIYINGTYSGGGTICGGSLPVTILAFNTFASNNNVLLNWTTGIELNNSGFDIERMLVKDGEVWKKTAFIQGNGTTNEPRQYSFEDKKLNTGTYKYRLKQIDYNGNYEYFAAAENVIISPPNLFSISQNYPNPSNPKSKIDFQMPFDGKVSIKVFDISGREVAILVNEMRTADFYTVEFEGTNLASGVYIYRIIADNNAGQRLTKTIKMILVK